MVIVAIVSAVAVPSLSLAGATRRDAAAAKVFRDLHFARQRAAARGVRTWVVFGVPNQTLTLFDEHPGNPGRVNRTVADDPGGGRWSVRLDRGPYLGAGFQTVDINGGNEVGFDYLGRPLDINEHPLVGDATVEMIGGATVRIMAETGHVVRD